MNLPFLKKITDMKDKIVSTIDDLNTGFIYNCSTDKLFGYIEQQLNYSVENKNQSVVNLYAYYNNKKYHIWIWNYTFSSDLSDRGRGIVFYIDDRTYNDFNTFINEARFDRYYLKDIIDEIKIELIDFDSDFFKN